MLTAAILLPILLIFLAKILFAIDSLICKFIDILFECFEVFAGVKTVTYNGKTNYLLDVFFENDIVTTVYWGMACIGFAMLFGFAIIAVVRKMFDSTGEKVKATYSHILTNCFKSMLLMLLMTAIVGATITASGVLMRAVTNLFDGAELIANPKSITFTEEDYATMYRILNTIGNYSLNPSYDSRYNLNACYNDIRNDMQDLERAGAFKFSYIISSTTTTNKTSTGSVISKLFNASSEPQSFTQTTTTLTYATDTWQYALLQIYKAADIYKDEDIDAVDDTLHNAILYCMKQIKTNPDFKPLSSYQDPAYADGTNIGVTVGRTIMLTASFGNAKQSTYDDDPGVTDPLRYPYYVGSKNIYDYDTVDEDFEIGIFGWNHLLVIIVGYFITKEMLIILINAAARIFNIILLYITAPPFLAAMPLDDGGKFKQWTTAFVIQSLSLFGSLFAVRLLVIFIPIVMSSSLRLFTNAIANYMAKLALLIGFCVTSEKASGMISGILADNAGYQSIMAGDVGSGVAAAVKQVAGAAIRMAASAGMKIGKGVAGAVDDVSGLTTKKNAIGDKMKNGMQSMRDHGGFKGAKQHGFQTKEKIEKDDKENKEEAKDKGNADFQNNITQKLDKFLGNNSGNNSSNGTDNKSTPDNKLNTQGEDKKPENHNNPQQNGEGGNEGESKDTPPAENK